MLTMVIGYSRWLSARLIPTRSAADLFAGWWQLIAALGAVPRVLVWDGERAIGRWRGGRVELTAECQAFPGTLAAKVIVCRPAEPEAKGLIERAHLFGALVSARARFHGSSESSMVRAGPSVGAGAVRGEQDAEPVVAEVAEAVGAESTGRCNQR
jgi:hypothetical protein